MSDDAELDGSESSSASRSDAWTDLALTLPIFLLYHLGVVFLPVRNAADPVTSELQTLAHESLFSYAALTAAIGIAFVLTLAAFGKKKAFAPHRFLLLGAEGVIYALVMRFAGAWALEALPLSAETDPGDAPAWTEGTFSSVVMSFGAGFYEELTFRVGLFGAGAWIVKTMEGKGPTGIGLMLAWGLVEAVAFSAWHHFGPGADPFEMRVFAYRAVCGIVLTGIYATRGFAPAVWTHALYDLWAMLGQ